MDGFLGNVSNKIPQIFHKIFNRIFLKVFSRKIICTTGKIFVKIFVEIYGKICGNSREIPRRPKEMEEYLNSAVQLRTGN